jgi:hypothetical protein
VYGLPTPLPPGFEFREIFTVVCEAILEDSQSVTPFLPLPTVLLDPLFMALTEFINFSLYTDVYRQVVFVTYGLY